MSKINLGKVVPVKGTDYWTNADKAELKDEVKQAVETDLENENIVKDANYVHTDNNYTTQEKQKLAGLSNYDDTEVKQSISNLNTNKADKNEIPDVSNFITKTVNDLTNYYLKNDTYTKQEVNTLIGQIATISIQVVQELPQSGQANIIYFVPKTGTTNDIYNEYIYVNNAYELIGSTQVDLTGYAKIEDIPTKLSDLTDDSTHRTVTDTEKTSWNNKSDFSGNYNDLSNKPTIPAEVTENTVSTWGFTKNTGTYSKPQNGIPKTDLESAVQTSLGKADTALQTHQDITGKLDTTKVKNAQSTTAGDVYDVRYINSVLGNIETLLQEV